MVTDLKKVGEFLAAPGDVFFATFPKVEWNQQIESWPRVVSKKVTQIEGDLQPLEKSSDP